MKLVSLSCGWDGKALALGRETVITTRLHRLAAHDPMLFPAHLAQKLAIVV